jgi:hypothetical protein
MSPPTGGMYFNGGHKADSYDYGGHPAPAGRALPNLINAVSILKSKSTSKAVLTLILTF